MKKSEPKIILNLSVENNELDEKVKIAIDKYVEQSVYAQLDETVEKIVSKRINTLMNGPSWASDKKINGVSFEAFVKSKTEETLTKIIEQNAKDILARKLANLL